MMVTPNKIKICPSQESLTEFISMAHGLKMNELFSPMGKNDIFPEAKIIKMVTVP